MPIIETKDRKTMNDIFAENDQNSPRYKIIKEERDSKIMEKILDNYCWDSLIHKGNKEKIDQSTIELKIEIKEAKENGVNLDAINRHGESLLNTIFVGFFQQKNHSSQAIELMEALIKEGANINFQNKEGNSFVHNLSLINYGSEEIIDFLSNKDLDLNARNSDGYTPVELAINQKKDDIAKYLHARSKSAVSFEEFKTNFFSSETKLFSGEDQKFCVFGWELKAPLNSLIGDLENSDLQ